MTSSTTPSKTSPEAKDFSLDDWDEGSYHDQMPEGAKTPGRESSIVMATAKTPATTAALTKQIVTKRLEEEAAEARAAQARAHSDGGYLGW